MTLPLAGYRVGVTSARKIEELTAMLERRGAEVACAPALTIRPSGLDDGLRAATEEVLASPVDVFLATTGVGVRGWFAAARSWGLADALAVALARSEVIARGSKAVGALRAHGLRELWSPPSECLEDVLAHLRGRSLDGVRIVLQEHGQSLSLVADALRLRGADVTVVTVYRCEAAADPAPLFGMVDLVADRRLDAVTFTSSPAVAALMDVAAAAGRLDDVVAAFRGDVLAACVGPVTAAAFESRGVAAVRPDRSRLASLVKTLERELPVHRKGTLLEVGEHRLLLHGERVRVDGVDVELSQAPLAVLRALAARPGHVVPRAQLMSHLPSGLARSEHAVEMAVARLRAAIGARLVQTVVKRGYRLPVT